MPNVENRKKADLDDRGWLQERDDYRWNGGVLARAEIGVWTRIANTMMQEGEARERGDNNDVESKVMMMAVCREEMR